MFRIISVITFLQIPTADNPARNKTLTFNFVHTFESESSWRTLTDKAKIVIPKKVYVTDSEGKRYSLAGTNKSIGGFSDTPPLFLRGDRVTIQAGYKYFDSRHNEVAPLNTIFEGYISKVSSKSPIEIECEDNMWTLKQIAAPNKLFPAKDYDMEKMLRELLQGTPYTVYGNTSTNIGDFRTQGETVCQVLLRLQKDYHCESYFRGNELRCGFNVYVEQDAIDDGTKVFIFQNPPSYSKTFQIQGGIISDELTYQRKDDIKLSATAHSINKVELDTLSKTGDRKTKTERLEVLVTFKADGSVLSQIKKGGQAADFPPTDEGERKDFYFWNVTDPQVLIQRAVAKLKQYYYTGMKGKFTTFGIPFVRQGDNVQLIDRVLPERNGVYKVRSVAHSGGIHGLRQHIELDYKIS